MQRDGWYTSERDALLLKEPERVGRYAAERSLSRLGSRKLSTRRVPILFEAPLASGLLGSFSAAASGGSLYRQASFLLDAMGTKVFPSHLSITESPHQLGGMGSAPFDDDGVATRARKVVDRGRLKGWFLSCYSARKLGMKTTGHAGGSQNLLMTSRLTQPGDVEQARLREAAGERDHAGPLGEGEDVAHRAAGDAAQPGGRRGRRRAGATGRGVGGRGR
jgi:PmbA protein